MLESVEDANGNRTRYNYVPDDEGTALGCPQAHELCESCPELYLSSISYSENTRTGLKARYRVDFSPESNANGPIERADTQSSARTGFKVVTRQLLSTIAVYFDDELIRRYQLDYVNGDFGKKLLQRIRVEGADGSGFYEHTFEYERRDQNLASDAFSKPTQFAAEPADTATITDSEEVSSDYHLFVGLSPTGTKDFSVGVRGGYDRRDSNVRSLLVDLNGDGLPDRLTIAHGSSGEPLYAATFNQDEPALDGFAQLPATPQFSPLLPDGDPHGNKVPDFADSEMPPDLGAESTDAFVGGLEVSGGIVSFSLGASQSTSSSSSALLDADGDGLIDHASATGVRFQRERRTGCVAGSLLCSPVDRFAFSEGLPIAPDLAEIAKNDPDFKAAELKVADEMYPEDALLQWVAPFGGTIDLDVKVKRRGKSQSELADGVAIQVFLNNAPLPVELDGNGSQVAEVQLGKADDAEHWLRRTGINVGMRDRLYFKVSTRDHFAVKAGPSPVPLDELTFEPVVRYSGKDHSLVDPTGGKVYEYALADDFRLAGDPIPAIALGVKGRVEAAVSLDKKLSTDDVRVCVQRFKLQEDLVNRVCDPRDTVLFSRTHDSVGFETHTEALSVDAGERLVFRQESDAPMDPGTAQVGVSLTVLERCIQNDCDTLPREGPGAIVAKAPVHVAVHVPARAPLEPYVVQQSGDYEIRGSYGTPSLLMPGFLVITKNGHEQLLKHKIPAFKVITSAKTPSVRLWLDEGDQLSFEFHTEIEASILTGWKATLYLIGEGDDGEESLTQIKDVQAANTFDVTGIDAFGKLFFREAKPMSGGYRGWRFGQWNGNFAFDESKIGVSDADQNPYKDLSAEDTLAQMQEDALDKNSTIAQLLKLYVPMAPQPDGATLRKGEGLWTGPDGFAYVGKGVIHAGRKGGYAVGPADANGEQGGALTALRFGSELRSAVAVNFSAGVGLLSVLNGSLGYGWSNSKADVLDMNGDRLIDVVTPRGTMLSDQLRIPRRQVDFGNPTLPAGAVWKFADDGIQKSTDFSLSAGLGIGTLITGVTSFGLEVLTGTRLPVGLIANTGFATSRQAVVQNLIDVNGDGLPDRVRREADHFYVQLNLGNRFADTVDRLDVSAWEGGLDGLGKYVDDNLGDVAGDIDGDKESDRQRNDRQRGLVAVLGAAHNANVIEHSTVMTFTESLGVSTPFAGISNLSETSLTKTPVQFIDVTGDGLPDYVKKGLDDTRFWVQVNKGAYFSDPIEMAAPAWKDAAGATLPTPCFRTRKYVGAPGLNELAASLLGQRDGLCSKPDRQPLDTIAAHGVHTDNNKLNGGFYLSIPIPTPIGALIINPGFDESHRESGFELGMQDLNGDGFADHVLKTRDGQQIYARLNQMGGGNLLKTIHRPLGGTIGLAYARVGNTVAMPESRYVLNTLTVDDGRATAASSIGHVYVNSFEYRGGVHDRRERAFYGFGSVLQKNPDGTVVAREFDTGSYSHKGLLVAEEHRAPSGAVLTRKDYRYSDTEVHAPAPACVTKLPFPLNEGTDGCRSVFPELREAKSTFYEAGGELVTRQTFGYDAFGNIASVLDTHHPGNADDTLATLTYTGDDSSRLASYVVNRVATLAEKTVNGGLVLRQRSALYDDRGNLSHLQSDIDGKGALAEYELTWTDEGNLDTFTDAANEKGDRDTLTYGYDGNVQTYVSSIRNTHFDLESSATIDPKFGQALATEDVTGSCTAQELDAFGRVQKVFGPEDVAEGTCAPNASATISIDYHHSPRPAYAITRNKLPKNAGTSASSLDTVTFVDGLARVIQSKKSAEVFIGGNRSVGFVASGHLQFDEMARVHREGQPLFSTVSAETYVDEPPTGPKLPTEHFYDLRGRPIETRFPDTTKRTFAYSLGTPARATEPYLKTVMVDAEGNQRVQYLDLEEHLAAVEEHDGKKVLTTSYRYLPTGELISIVDAKEHPTTLEYDRLGRRTAVTTQDTGRTEYRFDPAGNLIRKADADLLARKQEIVFLYDRNRLTTVVRPNGTPITYAYGLRGAPEHGAGRVVRITDEAGVEERGYDPLGAISRVTRKVRSLRPGAPSQTLTMRFDFDHFGRLLSAEYPDGESLRYGYDAGGQLRSAIGSSGGVERPYLKEVLYDEFGQRVAMALGNGTLTDYAYDAATRRLKTLKTALPGPAKQLIQNLDYAEYDNVGNLKRVTNALGAATNRIPGGVTQTFRYDALYRLVHAEGTAAVAPDTEDRYVSDFSYDEIHNMLQKTQVHSIVEASGAVVQHKATNHDLSYVYDPERPHTPLQIGGTTFVHTASGNALSETGSDNPKRRRYVWSDENWLREVVDNGDVTSFLYDANGDRVVKRGKYGESVYLGQWYTLRNGQQGTKHIFAGPTRVASRLDSAPANVASAAGTLANPKTVTLASAGHLTGIARACEVGEGVKVGLRPRCPDQDPGDTDGGGFDDTARGETFWYHSDHLGSSSYLTDERGRVFEHQEYFPFGETWVEDGPREPVSEFGFTAKPQDPETDLTYFGARYYDPRRARWISSDPAFLGQGTIGLNTYQYALWNPVRYVDPNGTTVAMAADSDPAAKARFLEQTSKATGFKVSEDKAGNLTRAPGAPLPENAAATEAFDSAASSDTPRFEITATKDGKYIFGDRFENSFAQEPQKNPRVVPAQLDALPETPGKGKPEATTRGELIAHIFAEYAEGARRGGFSPKTYPPSHRVGLEAQNKYRKGLGQAGTLSPTGANTVPKMGLFSPTGGGTLTINYSTGNSTIIETNDYGVVTSVDNR